MRIRGLSVVFAVAALGLGAMCSAQTEPKTVTYSTVAKTADKVIADLAAQTGEQLESTKDALRHVLVIHVEDVPLDELLDRIATVTSSRWAKSGDRRTLTPDSPLRRRIAQNTLREKVEEITESISDIKKYLQKVGNREFGIGTNTSFSGYRPISTPAGVALARLTVLLRPADIAKIEAGQRIVYSTSPNRMQRSLSGSVVNSVLSSLVAEHNAWFRSTSERREEARLEIEDQLAEMGEAASMFMTMFSGGEPKSIDSPVSEALLVVEQGGAGMFGMSDDLSTSLVLLDANGRVLLTEQMDIDSYFPDMDELMEITSADVEAATAEREREEPEEEPLSESDLVKVEFRDISFKIEQTSRYFWEEEQPKIAPEVLKVALSPFQYDPISFAQSDCLISLANAKGWNLVANVPDESSLSWLSADEDAVAVHTVLNYLEDEDEFDTLLEGGWFSVMSAHPVEALNERVDRAAVQTYVTRVNARGYASLDDMAYLASRMSFEASMSDAASAIQLVGHPMMMNFLGGEGIWETLRFWGSLSAGVKQSLLRGNSLNFNQLGSLARKQLTIMAFGTDADLMPRAQLEEERNKTMWDRLFSREMMGRTATTYLNEPTEVMPNGLPDMGLVSINITPGGLAVSSERKTGEMAFFQSVGAEEIALIQYMEDAAEKAGEDIGIPKLGTFLVGTRNRLEIVFSVSADAVMTRMLNDDKIEPGAKEVRLTNLPPEFVAEIERYKALIADSPFASMMMMGFGRDERIEPPE